LFSNILFAFILCKKNGALAVSKGRGNFLFSLESCFSQGLIHEPKAKQGRHGLKFYLIASVQVMSRQLQQDAYTWK